ncbi:type II toxin-antitoxin system Phd/YefM family antitoxin [uncultured Corynebacterium sp.]|uniref:type II toxin-antitoxin system Phd/YefM family antitoxin n=1 Tax=uncultured Corynebacterium sp. TaxID=159447 RepID=UPI0025E3A437|nr:type II toxin-antitoxin system prevent-host-death family antitoxin [uncultured Corynebacterium sp.]
MANTISVGQLRKNPTQMLRDVRKGATYTITDHGEPVAEVTPRQQQARWVTSEEFNEFLQGLDNRADLETWAAEIDDMRDAEHPRDPWEQNE